MGLLAAWSSNRALPDGEPTGAKPAPSGFFF